MPIWPALLVTPLVALGQQSITYALVPAACHAGSVGALHAVAALSIALSASLTLLAWRAWRDPVPRGEPASRSARRRHLLASVAVMVGSLSTLVSAAMWLPVWMLSPCIV